jgi:hypothetical protein
MIPFAVDASTAYGFAATPSDQCGQCFELTFTGSGHHGGTNSLSGKKMIVMGSNMGGDVQGGQFDLLVPGGGLGAFDSFSGQIGVSKNDLGAQYGGLLTTCNGSASCLKEKCASVFSGQPLLKQGCDFYADWMGGANNPNLTYKTTTCPQVLVDIYKGTATGPGGGGNPIVTPPTQTYTLQVGRSPTAGGNVKVNNGQDNPTGQSTHNGGTSITIAATANSGYTFQNWTAVSGTQLPSGISANSASITFSINSIVNIQANFQQTTPTTNYTLQVSRSPTAGGSVAVTVGNNTQNNPQNSQTVSGNTPVTVAATPASGYTFSNWTAVSGSLPSGFNANSASVTFNMPSANVNVRANFSPSGTIPPGTAYTLTVNRNPANGGTTNPAASQSNIEAGTPFNISANASDGYSFNNWTVTTGSVTFANANSAATTVTLNSNATITANFRLSNVKPGNGTDTVKVEAEDYTSKNGDNMVTSTNAGITNIGYIENGYSVTYANVGVGNAGARTMVFRIASNYDQGQSSFKVTVNNAEVGTVSGHTNDWDGYTYVTLSPDVQFNAGANTIKLDFQSPVNVDYFLIIGEAAQVSVRYSANRTAAPARSAVSLTASPRGFTATLPANHGYTTYRLIDLQGREVRSGKVGDGISSLRFNNLKNSVLFLRLEGKNTSTVVKAITY